MLSSTQLVCLSSHTYEYMCFSYEKPPPKNTGIAVVDKTKIDYKTPFTFATSVPEGSGDEQKITSS